MADAPTAPPPSNPIVYTGDGQVLNAPRLTPEQAATALAEYTAAYEARRNNAPPAAESLPAGSVEHARARLHQIHNTPELRDKLLTGNSAVRREWDAMHRIVVDAGESTQAGMIETTDSISDPAALTMRERAGLLDSMSDRGMTPELTAYLNALDKGQAEIPSEGDKIAATRALDRLNRNVDFQKAIANGDPVALANRMKLMALKSWGAPDGRPVSPIVQEWLAARGLM
jgi:hypothetical protein